MIDMLKRHEVQVLRRAGHGLKEVAKLPGVSQSSVQRIEGEAPVVALDVAAERTRRRVGRPSKVEAYRGVLAAEIAKQPDVIAVELLRRAWQAGYRGGKSALYTLIRAIRPREVGRPLVRFEGLPGEFSQHDFGEVDVRFLDGHSRRVHFFASRLKYSRWAQVSLVEDERVESLVRALVDHFAAIGGIPLLAVFDRPKTIAIAWRRDGVVTEWNSTFANVILDLERYTHPHVLVIDEVGYLTYGTDAANMLFHVVNDRHKRKRAMIFTTNKPLAAWGQVLHDEDLAQAIVIAYSNVVACSVLTAHQCEPNTSGLTTP
jgi:transposase